MVANAKEYYDEYKRKLDRIEFLAILWIALWFLLKLSPSWDHMSKWWDDPMAEQYNAIRTGCSLCLTAAE